MPTPDPSCCPFTRLQAQRNPAMMHAASQSAFCVVWGLSGLSAISQGAGDSPPRLPSAIVNVLPALNAASVLAFGRGRVLSSGSSLSLMVSMLRTPCSELHGPYCLPIRFCIQRVL